MLLVGMVNTSHLMSVRDKNEWFDWNKWRNNYDEFKRQYLFSLIDFYPETEMWLFGGVYKILERGKKWLLVIK